MHQAKAATKIFVRAEDEDQATEDTRSQQQQQEKNPLFKEVTIEGDSFTMGDLIDQHGITSLVECDDHGSQKSRGLAIREPNTKLKPGGHYVVRELAASKNKSIGEKAVLFQSNVNVRNYRPSKAPAAIEDPAETPLQGGTQLSSSQQSSCSQSIATNLPRLTANANVRDIPAFKKSDETLVTGAELQALVNEDFAFQEQEISAEIDEFQKQIAQLVAGGNEEEFLKMRKPYEEQIENSCEAGGSRDAWTTEFWNRQVMTNTNSTSLSATQQ